MTKTANTSSFSDSFSPLAQPVFAVLWVAAVLGNTGSFIRDVTSSWLVTELSASPAAVALIQTAATLPIFLLAIPAGVLADILDRRRFLIGIQVLLACVSITLLILTRFNALTVEYLIGMTFVGGIGAALMGPVWQSIVPELVPRADLKNAVALNSLGINVARAIGPAVGGVLLARFGASSAYGVDVVSYVVVIAALFWWKRPVIAHDVLSEHFLGALRAGLRFTRSSRELHVVLVRSAVFFLFASSVWALLPLVARQLLHGTAGFYGVLLGAVGVGAIVGALVLPKLRAHVDSDGLVLAASACSVIVMAGLAAAPPQWCAVILMLLLGVGWIIALTTLNSVAQAVLPNWVRGRALAIYLMVFNGAMAAGSLAWGLVAQELGVPPTLMIAAAGLAVVALVFHRLRLPHGEQDLQASNHWPEPMTSDSVTNDRGPVLILIEYSIEVKNHAAFVEAMHKLSLERRRDGAYLWGITEDAEDPEKVVEWFTVESWAEHLRQHRRVSNADADLQKVALQFHQGSKPPVVRHFLTMERKTDGRA